MEFFLCCKDIAVTDEITVPLTDSLLSLRVCFCTFWAFMCNQWYFVHPSFVFSKIHWCQPSFSHSLYQLWRQQHLPDHTTNKYAWFCIRIYIILQLSFYRYYIVWTFLAANNLWKDFSLLEQLKYILFSNSKSYLQYWGLINSEWILKGLIKNIY